MRTGISDSSLHSVENLVKYQTPLYKNHGTTLADIDRTLWESVRDS
jgi:hypothetical protein